MSMGNQRIVTNQNITVAGTSAATSNAMGSQTFKIRIATTTDAYFAIGPTPTATTSDPVLPAGTVDYVKINPGEKVAALQVTAGGVFSVGEMG